MRMRERSYSIRSLMASSRSHIRGALILVPCSLFAVLRAYHQQRPSAGQNRRMQPRMMSKCHSKKTLVCHTLRLRRSDVTQYSVDYPLPQPHTGAFVSALIMHGVHGLQHRHSPRLELCTCPKAISSQINALSCNMEIVSTLCIPECL